MGKPETHRIYRSGWLRAAVLGANDGIISIASVVLGVAAAGVDSRSILAAGIASMIAGAMSMAAGEYISVSSQADIERADLVREREALARDPEGEHSELTSIYVKRGLDPQLAARVAAQLMAHNPLDAHARDELGISEALSARPIQAALSSAGSFAGGALLPILAVSIVPVNLLMWALPGSSLVSLALLGAISATVGGAPVLRAVLRVTFWGALAMAFTSAVGALFGTITG